MKKHQLLLLTMLLAVTGTMAQKQFPLEWKTEFPVEAKWRMINDDRTLMLGGDWNEMAMMSATDGKLLWKCNFKERFGAKKAIDWNWHKEEGLVWARFKGDKKDEEKIYYLDDKTGTDAGSDAMEKRKKEKSRRAYKGYVTVAAINSRLHVEYEKKRVVGSGNTKKKTALTVICEGDVTWSQTVDGKLVRSLCDNAGGYGFGGDFMSLTVQGDKVFLVTEGISVLDLKTGRLLWETTFDNTEMDFGLFKSRQSVGRADLPLATNEGVYIADLSDKQHRIKKFDPETGKVLWESVQFDKDAIVPELKISGDILFARFGGKVNEQTYIPGMNGNPDVCKSEYKMVGDYGVRAYDKASGKMLWETFGMKELGDKFGGSISNMMTEGDNVYVCSDKNLFALNAATGKVVYSVPTGKMKIGKAERIWPRGAATIIEGTAGVASINRADGKVNFAKNTGACLSTFTEGEAYFIWTGKSPAEWSEFVRFNLDEGTIPGKAEKTSNPYFTPDGAAYIKFDGSKVMRYKTL